MQADVHDKRHITLYMSEAVKDTFSEKFHAECYFHIVVAALTPETAKHWTQYATLLQQQKRQTYIRKRMRRWTAERRS